MDRELRWAGRVATLLAHADWPRKGLEPLDIGALKINNRHTNSEPVFSHGSESVSLEPSLSIYNIPSNLNFSHDKPESINITACRYYQQERVLGDDAKLISVMRGNCAHPRRAHPPAQPEAPHGV